MDQLLNRSRGSQLADVPRWSGPKTPAGQSERFYLDFLEEKRTDPNLLREAGRAYCRLGEIQEILGEYPSRSAPSGRRSNCSRSRRPERPAGVDARPDLARCSADLGSLLKKADRFREAEIAAVHRCSCGYPPSGARQLLFFSAVTLRILGRRVKGCPGRLRRCLTRRSSSHRAAALTWRMASAPSGSFQNISVPFTR